MTQPGAPQVVIPRHESPVGTRMTIETIEGRLTYEKAADGDWTCVGFDAAPPREEES